MRSVGMISASTAAVKVKPPRWCRRISSLAAALKRSYSFIRSLTCSCQASRSSSSSGSAEGRSAAAFSARSREPTTRKEAICSGVCSEAAVWMAAR